MANEEKFNFEVGNETYEAVVPEISDGNIATGVCKYIKDQRGAIKTSDIRDGALILAAVAISVVAVKYGLDEYSAKRQQKAEIAGTDTPESIVIDDVVYKAESPEIEERIVVDGVTYVIEQPEQNSPSNQDSQEVETHSQSVGSRAEIEANRTYSFSQIIASINHYPEMVEKDGLKYWDVNESAGQIVVTRPYGEMSEKNPHNEKVEFNFFPNDEQIVFEWNELDIRENLPSLAFWIKTDSTGGKVKIEFFDKEGNTVKEHKGEMVMASWTDTNGEQRQAIQFKDEVSGETRPPAFQITEVEFDQSTGKAVDVKHPYHTAKVTMEPTPGSRMELATGPTIPFGPNDDQGFGF